MTAESTITIIVNADDYGITPGVTKAIVELLDSGCIATSTVMMCALNSEQNQAPFRSEVDSTRLGLHLQITGGIPMRSGVTTSFVDPASGRFRGRESVATASPHLVLLEWRAQVEAFIGLYGHVPSHFDTHHGTHKSPQLLEPYCSLAAEYGLPVRGAGVPEIDDQITELGVRHTSVIEDDWTGGADRAEPARSLLAAVRETAVRFGSRTIEVVTHPGFVDDELRSISSLSDERAVDYAGLRGFADLCRSSAGELVLATSYLQS